MKSTTRIKIARIAAILVALGISLYIFSIRDQAEKLAIYGYPGVFLLTFFAYGTVLLPAPGAAIVIAMGTVLNPLGVGVAAGLGCALGESVGYLLGFGGQGVVERADIYEKLYKWMVRYGSLTVFILAVLPNPFFDVAGIIAGALKMAFIRFFLSCWAGETIKMTAFAYLGRSSFNVLFG